MSPLPHAGFKYRIRPTFTVPILPVGRIVQFDPATVCDIKISDSIRHCLAVLFMSDGTPKETLAKKPDPAFESGLYFL